MFIKHKKINNKIAKKIENSFDRKERKSGLTDGSSSKITSSKYTGGSRTSNYLQSNLMIPVDIECLNESQLLALKNKIDSKLTQKSISWASGGNSYKAYKMDSIESNSSRNLKKENNINEVLKVPMV
jgi:hypothetical protein